MDPWDRAAPLDRLIPVDLETLQDPDLPTGDVNQLNQESEQEYLFFGSGERDRWVGFTFGPGRPLMPASPC